MFHFCSASIKLVFGALCALLLYHHQNMSVWLSRSDAIYAVTPDYFYYNIPDNGTIRMIRGGSAELGYIRLDPQTQQLRLYPGESGSLFGPSMDPAVNGLSLTLRRKDGYFRLSQLPAHNNHVLVSYDFDTGNSNGGTLAWDTLYHSIVAPDSEPLQIKLEVKPNK